MDPTRYSVSAALALHILAACAQTAARVDRLPPGPTWARWAFRMDRP